VASVRIRVGGRNEIGAMVGNGLIAAASRRVRPAAREAQGGEDSGAEHVGVRVGRSTATKKTGSRKTNRERAGHAAAEIT